MVSAVSRLPTSLFQVSALAIRLPTPFHAFLLSLGLTTSLLVYPFLDRLTPAAWPDYVFTFMLLTLSELALWDSKRMPRFSISPGIDLATMAIAGPNWAVVNALLGRLGALLVRRQFRSQAWVRGGYPVYDLLRASFLLALVSFYWLGLGGVSGSWVGNTNFGPFLQTILLYTVSDWLTRGLGYSLRYAVGLSAALARDVALNPVYYLAQPLLAVFLAGFYFWLRMDLFALVLFGLFLILVIYATYLYVHVREAYWGTLHALVRTLEAKDEHTSGHSHRVLNYVVAMGRKMLFSEEDILLLYGAGLLHDIGKMAIPDAILLKEGQLTNKEFREIKNHSVYGGRITGRIPFLEAISPSVRHHHEFLDGTGYPDRLAGTEIPLAARVLTVAEVYDAMRSGRPYHPQAMTHAEAIEQLRQGSGQLYDKEVVTVFQAVIKEEREWGGHAFQRHYSFDYSW